MYKLNKLIISTTPVTRRDTKTRKLSVNRLFPLYISVGQLDTSHTDQKIWTVSLTFRYSDKTMDNGIISTHTGTMDFWLQF